MHIPRKLKWKIIGTIYNIERSYITNAPGDFMDHFWYVCSIRPYIFEF